MNLIAWIADLFRPSIALATPLVCPRCGVVRDRCTTREAQLLIAGEPLMHHCGARYTRGTR